ncbi:tRNA pseudouridine(55) synthase TruB [Serinibacter salmoneus]|uniref:tRNA pseudouridine synthase B n=1 Tax=Serinibacter salmoneus TaxID=556530 RepID=A0A2A9CZB9_9MICO|nr:tRNA pseudouridine(55) synthase TruB [Serinibacter salmoneus]PFG19335.1 tRNA pseudouridine synthase B [Serinibacter salmoneus]
MSTHEHERPSGDPPDGLLVLDKPAGWTSHDVVARCRRLLGTKKVGHAGTLDPMATGVLVLGVGRATRLLTYVVGADKTYEATIRLGQDTLTDDAEGEITAARGACDVAPQAVHDGVARLRGDIQQVPSAVSAIKIQGKRSYARVRAGEEVALAARPVHIAQFAIHTITPGAAADGTAVLDVTATVTCSSGTYIRALARDLGAHLGCGGHLTALRRTRVGGFPIAGALPQEAITEADQAPSPRVRDAVVPSAVAAEHILPVRRVGPEEAADLGHGRWLAPTGSPEPVAALGPGGELLAILRDEERRGGLRARPVIVFA